MMKLGSEGVYLHEKCGTDPSRHLPGPTTHVKQIKNADVGVSGFRAKIIQLLPPIPPPCFYLDGPEHSVTETSSFEQ